jgi:hypothetical protein
MNICAGDSPNKAVDIKYKCAPESVDNINLEPFVVDTLSLNKRIIFEPLNSLSR